MQSLHFIVEFWKWWSCTF